MRARFQSAARRALALQRSIDGELEESDAIKELHATYMGSVVERALRLLRAMNTNSSESEAIVGGSGAVAALVDLLDTTDWGAAASAVRVRRSVWQCIVAVVARCDKRVLVVNCFVAHSCITSPTRACCAQRRSQRP